jgi:hypothetical protein
MTTVLYAVGVPNGFLVPGGCLSSLSLFKILLLSNEKYLKNKIFGDASTRGLISLCLYKENNKLRD